MRDLRGAVTKLMAIWNARPASTGRRVLLVASEGDRIAQDVARLPGAQTVGNLVVAIVGAGWAARFLDIMYGFIGDAVREADPARALVVQVSGEDAAAVYLDELHAGAAVAGETKEERSMKKTSTQQVMPVEPAPEKPARKPKKKAKRREWKKFGKGLYGTQTKLSVAETQEQIRAMLRKYGCDRFGFVDDTTTGQTTVQFRCHNRTIRFVLELPDAAQFSTRPFKNGEAQLPAEIVKARHEKALRGRWRALYAAIKAKIVLVTYGIETFEDCFLPETVDPASGLTVAKLVHERKILPALAAAPGDGARALKNGVGRAEVMA